jgi:hypothetical protein
MANYHDIRYDMTLSSSTTGGGSMVLLETQTASSSSTVSFTSGIDSTYDEYVFKFYDIHPSTEAYYLAFQGNASGGSGYNETITSTFFYTHHAENDSGTPFVSYDADGDQAQGTGFQQISVSIGTDNDQNGAGELRLFKPSSTTFVKHWIAKVNTAYHGDGATTTYTSGYFNTTSAIDEIQFKMTSGNIDAGTFKMYGVL